MEALLALLGVRVCIRDEVDIRGDDIWLKPPESDTTDQLSSETGSMSPPPPEKTWEIDLWDFFCLLDVDESNDDDILLCSDRSSLGRGLMRDFA